MWTAEIPGNLEPGMGYRGANDGLRTSHRPAPGLTGLRSGGLRLTLAPASGPLQQESVEPQATAAGFGRRDGHFDLELVVTEFLDGVATVNQRPSGACVLLALHLASPLTWPCRLWELLHELH